MDKVFVDFILLNYVILNNLILNDILIERIGMARTIHWRIKFISMITLIVVFSSALSIELLWFYFKKLVLISHWNLITLRNIGKRISYKVKALMLICKKILIVCIHIRSLKTSCLLLIWRLRGIRMNRIRFIWNKLLYLNRSLICNIDQWLFLIVIWIIMRLCCWILNSMLKMSWVWLY